MTVHLKHEHIVKSRAARKVGRSMSLGVALLLGCVSADLHSQGRTPAAQARPAGVACAPGDTALFPTPPLRESVRWYGKHLRAAREGRLCAFSGDEVYRFTWLRTFHAPVVIRVERRGASHTLTAKRLSGAGGYEPGRLVVNRSAPLSSSEWTRLHALLDSAAFWSPRTAATGSETGLDGAQWILEGVHGTRYRALDRSSPKETGSDRYIRAAGMYLLRLARLTPSAADEIY